MKRDYVFSLLAAVAGLLLRLVALHQTGFDGLYGQDAYAYHDFAGSLLALAAHGESLPSFFWPLGYPTLLALAGGGAQAGQVLNVALGSLLGPLIYGLTRQAGARPAAALAAALIAAFGGQAVQSSLVLMSDIPALLWATAGGVALLRYVAVRRARWLYAAGLLLTLAILTRYQYAALLVPWGLAIGMARTHPRHVMVIGMLALPLAALQAVYSATTPYPTLNHPWATSWSPAHFFARSFDTVDGHFEYAQTNASYYAQPMYGAPYLVPALGALAAPGIYALRRRRIVLALLGGWVAVPYVFLAGIPYQNVRFSLILLPGAAALVGAGVEGVLSTRAFATSRLRCVLFAGVCALALVQLASDGLTYARAFVERQQADKAVVFWVGDTLPMGATVYTQGLLPALRHYTRLEPVEIYLETPQTLAARPTGTHDYLLVNMWQIEHQWAGRAPELAVRWLRETRGLVEIGRFGVYTLYGVRNG